MKLVTTVATVATVATYTKTRLAKFKDTDTMKTQKRKMPRHLFMAFLPYSFVISDGGRAITLLNREYQPIQAAGKGERKREFYNYDDFAIPLFRKLTAKQLAAIALTPLSEPNKAGDVSGQFWMYQQASDTNDPSTPIGWQNYQKRLFKLMQLCYAVDY